MFSDIEREYKKALQQKRFFVYYWPKVVFIVIIAVLCDLGLGVNRWLAYGCTVVVLILLVAYFFLHELRVANKTIPSVRSAKGISAKIHAYNLADDALRIQNLADDLARHDINTKDDLGLTLEYFQTRLPSNSRPNLLAWILTAVITVSSVIIVAYDNALGTVDIQKLISVFVSTAAIALVILTPFILAKFISAGISNSRNKVDTSLVEDLAYIYVHFEDYRGSLSKKTT